MADCVKLKERKAHERRGNVSKPVSFVKRKPHFVKPDADIDPVQQGFEPFISKGVVTSLDGLISVPIDILRDTGASQTLLLADTLPFGTSGESVLIQGIEGGKVNVPLHKVNLSSELVSGPVSVGVTGSLPVKGVHLLLGNDLAGGKVAVAPVMTDNPVLNDDVSPIEEEIPHLFPACAVTRAMARRAEKEKKAESKSDLLHGLDDTFLHRTFSPESYFDEHQSVHLLSPSGSLRHSSSELANPRVKARFAENDRAETESKSDLLHGFDGKRLHKSNPRGFHSNHSSDFSDVSSFFVPDQDVLRDPTDCSYLPVSDRIGENVRSEGLIPSFSQDSTDCSSLPVDSRVVESNVSSEGFAPSLSDPSGGSFKGFAPSLSDRFEGRLEGFVPSFSDSSVSRSAGFVPSFSSSSVSGSEGFVPSFSDSSVGHVSNKSTRGAVFAGPKVQSFKLSSKEKLSFEQRKDPTLSSLFSKVVPESEIDNHQICYYVRDGVLMRRWRPPDVNADADWAVKHQVVLPVAYRAEALTLAHDQPMAGHLGVTKTYQRLLNEFFWPGIKRDTAVHCKSCHTCQMVGKPNQKVPPAPLRPIPAFEEPFSRVLIDCVGPLPKTKSGNEYLLTIMCSSTRFPEAIPLRNIKAKTIVKALVKFFSLFGLPKAIQSDQGSNFMSHIFQQVLHELKIDQYKSSAYHPESQGALERFHQTLKSMIRTYCSENKKDWDDGIHWLLFAARESVQESLGFSPFELVFGHNVRGPLKVMKEKLLSETSPVQLNLLDYVSDFKLKLVRACEIAKKNLRESQFKMKTKFDKKSVERHFDVGDKVLALLPMQGNSLQARYFGPYEIVEKISDVNYVISTPERRKGQQLCHVNMLKSYVDRNSVVQSVNVVSSVPQPTSTASRELSSSLESTTPADSVDMDPTTDDFQDTTDSSTGGRLNNSDILKNLDSKLQHLSGEERQKMKNLILEYKHLFPDVPSRTDKIFHDVDIGEAKPIKQHPYRLNPEKQKYLKEEIQYLLENDLIEPSQSEWASPCILIPKPDGSYRFCTDFRKVNSVTKTDSFPLPRIDDCIDKIGNARYVSKFDLLKGFWQIPLTERAKDISAFITPDGLFRYKVAPFGMKNCPATFQRLMNQLIAGMEGIAVYLDDAIVYSDDFDQHLEIIREFFDRLTDFHLTVNLVKSEFCQGTLTYLGHVVGQGQVKPVSAKVQAIIDFPVPQSKKQLMRFLGMAGYYRKFCNNFSTLSAPLTNLLKKSQKFLWSQDCQNAFDQLKAMLQNAPVLSAPDFDKPFKLAVDASDLGAGAVLFQADSNDIDHPVSYFSKKFNRHQRNYSTVEKECLALILALQHFEVYVSSTSVPLEVFTDHNPLTFLNRQKSKNQRLLRWSLLLQNFNLDIKHIRGKDNVVADTLSRTGSAF